MQTSHMSGTLLKVEVEVGVDPKSFCKTMGFAYASLWFHILISNGDSCRLVVGGSSCLLRFFEEAGAAIVVATRDALAVAVSGLVVLIALSLVLAAFLGSEAAFLAGQSLSKWPGLVE